MKKLIAFLTALFLLLACTPSILPGQDRPKTVRTDVLTEKTLTKQVAEFSAYVEKGMLDWQIPGMAVVVVKDNKIILQKGYGLRELGKDDPVDIETIFACASTTKAMTAVCMGILVDEGKLNWDDKVNKFLPEFKVNDPYITSELRIRDLLTHNSGIGNTDFLWGLMDISNQEIVDRMSLVRPSYSLRSGFIYQNIFYLIAGEVIAKVSKLSWEDFIKQRIFDPLGMKRSFTRYSMLPDQNRSTPHYMIQDTVMKITPFPADNIAPAGSVRSCAEDMGKWVLCMLDSSKYQNGRLLKPETWNELFRPQVIIRDEMYPTSRIIWRIRSILTP
jgi:CubicO group peptidase (beta-lactamase class C family)